MNSIEDWEIQGVGAIPPSHKLRKEGVVYTQRWTWDLPLSNTLATEEGTDGDGRLQGIRGGAIGKGSKVRGHSVVELALARLVNEAALVLRPARTALPGAVLPLHHFSAQRVAFSSLSGPLQPPHLTRLIQQHSPRGHRRSRVVQGPGLPAGRRQFSVETEHRSLSRWLARLKDGVGWRTCD